MTHAQGGCLCAKIRYDVKCQPTRTTLCHCKFCQRATGGAYLVEPIFDEKDFEIFKGHPKTYTHVSMGSGKNVFIHFCDNCGTKLFLTFERFANTVGVFGGTFDDPNWYDLTPENSKHIFLGSAQRGTVIPPHVNTFMEHATTQDGTPITPKVCKIAQIITKR